MKRFNLFSRGNKVELEILEKISDHKIMVNVKTKGLEINNAEANIVQITSEPGKLFLQIKEADEDKYLKIADIDKHNFKYIADWIWENVHDKNTQANTYSFTTYAEGY